MIGKSTFLFLFIFLHVVAIGQTISGRVVDDKQVPLAYSTIALLNSVDSSVVKGSLASEEGVFTIEQIAPGSYFLKIEAIGFIVKYTEAIVLDSISKIDLQDIILSTSAVNLNEVYISAIKRTIEFKNGNIVVNVEDSPLAKGNTVYDLLTKLPGVSVNNQEIKINGKEGVIFMIDGRVQQMSAVQLFTMLKSMNAEIVEKIEIMKNPPVKYDANGTAGMIHIKTKKTKINGFNGSVYTSASQGFYARSMAGLSLNYKSEKWVLFSNIDYNYGFYQRLETYRSKFTTDTTVTEFTNNNALKDLDNSFEFKIGADWLVNKNNTIGFKIDGGPGLYKSNATGVNRVSNYNSLGYEHLDAIVSSPDKWNFTNYNVNAEHIFDTLGTVLNFTSDYTLLKENQSSLMENYFFDDKNVQVLPAVIYKTENQNYTGILAAKLDFTKVIDSISSFETGLKSSFTQTNNDYLFQIKNTSTNIFYKDSTLTNNYTYTEQTYAVYFNYIRAFGNFNLQAGVRAENTNLLGKNADKHFEIKRSYVNLFPNISLEYNVNDKHQLQLNLNRRIDRPDYSDLNPFRSYRNLYAYYEGNPFLLPHYSNVVELTHNYNEFMSNSFSYSRIDNVMMTYTKQNDSTKVNTQSVKNMKLNNNYSYSLFIQKSIQPWWELNFNTNISFIEFKGDVNSVNFRTASFFFSPSLNNTFVVAKNTKLEVLSFYHSGQNIGLVQIRSRWMVSLALKKSFFKEKLDCSIGVDDVFYSAYYRTQVKFDNQDWNFRAYQDTRRITFSLNYNFGKVKVEERSVESNEEEKGRLNH